MDINPQPKQRYKVMQPEWSSHAVIYQVNTRQFSKEGNFEFKLLNNIKQFSTNSEKLREENYSNDQEKIYKNWIPSQKKINQNDKLHILKTHNALCSINDYKFTGNLPLPKDGRVSFLSDNEMKKEYWLAIGYLRLNNFALRIDVFERVFFIARQKVKIGPFLDSADLMNPVGCNREHLKDILSYCGFSFLKLPNERILFFNEQKKTISKPQKIKTKKVVLEKKSKNKKILNNNKKLADPNSPFAVLEKLL